MKRISKVFYVIKAERIEITQQEEEDIHWIC